MRRLVWAGLVGLCLSAWGVAQSRAQGTWAAPTDKTAQTLIDMERQWAEAPCNHNLIVERILADDFYGTAPNGSRYTKAQAVQREKSLKDGSHDCRLVEAKG